MPLIVELLEINDPENLHVDAGAHTSRWDTIPDLYDTDSGIWGVRTEFSDLIFDMGQRQLYSRSTGVGGTPMGRENFVAVIEVRIGAVATWSIEGKDEPVRRTSLSAVTSIYRIDEGNAGSPEGADSGRPPGRPGPLPSRVRSVRIEDAALHFTDLVADVASRGDQIALTGHAEEVTMIAAELLDSLAFLAEGVRELVQPNSVDITQIVGVGHEVVELRDSDAGIWHVQTSGQSYILDLDDWSIRDAVIDEDGEIIFDRVRFKLHHLDQCRVGVQCLWQTNADSVVDQLRARQTIVRSITRLDPWMFD